VTGRHPISIRSPRFAPPRGRPAWVRSSLLAAALATALVGVAPGSAHATTATIKRSVQNLAFFPIDFVLSPYVATRAVYRNWRSSDDTPAVKIVYPIPGVAWAISVNMGASVIRGIAGALEFLPGLVLIPFKSDMAPLYDLAENNAAVYDSGEDHAFRVKIGVDYVSPAEY
jgi:hypothetical protein